MNDQSSVRPVAVAVRRALGSAGMTLLALSSLAAANALAQEQATAPAAAESANVGGSSDSELNPLLGEVTVTGTRIVRDGYEAPTPVAVLGNEQLAQMGVTNIADAVNRLPAISSSISTRTQQSNIGTGTAGVNTLNLRALGANRTLVLLDGKRMVPSSLGTGGNAGAVDVNQIPNGLVQRVEIVTGGASAVYGSDALAGVVNFILDKKFTGLKGSVDGGITEAGDGENYRLSLTGGMPFADGRGHLLFSGEYADDKGVIGNNRSWADTSYQLMNNPDYAPGNGQPQLQTVFNAGVANGTRGGLILDARPIGSTTFTQNTPFRGTAFGEGGTPYTFNFGRTANGSPVMEGGDWEASRIDRSTTLGLPLTRRTMFGRGSFDVTDNLTAFVELQYSHTKSHNRQVVPNLNNGSSVTILRDNAFLSPEMGAAMDTAGINAFRLGTFNGDLPYLQGINTRELKRVVGGVEGNFDMFGTEWSWDAYFTHGEQDISSITPGNRINARYTAAVNAVRDPLTGRIVCANGDPTCIPYNPMGLGVNTQAAINYVTGMGYADTLLTQQVGAASMNGEPFSTWAGPVSVAFGAEHRREKVSGSASELDEANAFFAGNYHATQGKYDVTEGFFETVVPLLNNVPGAESLDLNGAVRYTDYSTSGEVTTWKIGATWQPLEDFRFRFTKSRDIRAPNLGELFNSGQSGTGNTSDPFLNIQYLLLSVTSGNLDLKPEEADTTGLGIVFSPRFLPGFQASVDYYKIEIDGAMATLSTTNILNGCFAGNALLCSYIERDPATAPVAGGVSRINIKPDNILGQELSGFDVEASYTWILPAGQLRLRGLASFVESMETYDLTAGTLDGRGVNSDSGGIGLGTALTAPKYRYLTSATYDLDQFSVGLTMRGVSSGVYNNAFIECQANCPTATALNPTIDNNKIDGAEYFDLSLNYKLDGAGEVYFVTENLFDEDPALVAGGRGAGYYQGQDNKFLYDRYGRTFRAGYRFQF
ncbi:TonB-dependent receptor domain-containing protein [Povalibacter sp.]|uniref:TonB-dependent receptor domain-containing protein n=1 Tax=Povalibacter sp. TaxID=1962978 RepID=UPI002F41BF84